MAPDGAASRFKTRFSNLSFLHGFPANAHAVTPLPPPPPPLPQPLPRSNTAYDVRQHEHVRSVSSGTARDHAVDVARHVSHRAEVVPAGGRHDSYPINIDEWASPGPGASRYPSVATMPSGHVFSSPTSPHTLPSPTSFGVRRKPSGARPPPPPLNLDAARKTYVRADRAPIELHAGVSGVEELSSPLPLSPLDVAHRVPLQPSHYPSTVVVVTHAADDRPVHVEDEHAYPAFSPAPRVWSALQPDRYRHSPSPRRDDAAAPRRPPPASPLELHDVALTPAPTRPMTQFSARVPSHHDGGGGLKALGKRLSRALPTAKAVRFEPPHHRLSSENGSVLDVRWAEEGAAGAGTGGGGTKGLKEPMTRQRREAFFRKYKCALIILVLILLGTGILAAVLATQHTTAPDQAAAKGDSAPPPSGTTASASASHSASSASSTATSTATADPHAAAAACIAEFNALTTNGESYPCSSCVPVLSTLPNDFATTFPNATAAGGPGAALQFCALRDVLDSVPPGANNTLKAAGWIYATDPIARLPPSLANLVSLNLLHVNGNSSLPAGPFPTEVLSLRNLTQLYISDTALTGAPLAVNSSSLPLQSITLIGNPAFGNAVPDASKFDKLQTLVITNQNLSRPFDASLIPPSVTYLDLSYNNLSGSIPDLSRLSSLATLYLQSNDFTTLPPALPAALTSISFTNNPHLNGALPKTLCAGTVSSCDLRNTALSAAKVSCGACLFN
ncbi:Leucine-rich repeat receptor protein kinase EMS1 [Vanrija pseudolonga]|uniref:Leucine-rich repeat receptor protein kinase EMS1 n=1 Tax=Vanrija pseudolonga TaxID=143232 RepID=A0AAF1BKX2_9TREE|nr:Leucine-rich repeat receptor protein kinase EMS1 [Vanrija pseudolonga]